MKTDGKNGIHAVRFQLYLEVQARIDKSAGKGHRLRAKNGDDWMTDLAQAWSAGRDRCPNRTAPA